MHKFEKTARKRLEILWKYYNENGQLLLKDITRLTGISYDNLYKTFEAHNLKGPIVYDSREEKIKRKAERLNKEAARLGQNYLTLKQAAKVLGSKASDVLGVEIQMMKYDLSIPELRNESDVQFYKYYNSNPEDNEIAHKINGTVNPLWHPTGLQVSTFWINWPAQGQTTYLLR